MNKKRIMQILLSLFALFITAIALVSCDSHSHVYWKWITIEKATCTENGERIGECFCGETRLEVLYAIGHDYKGGVCKKCGSTEYKEDYGGDDENDKPEIDENTTGAAIYDAVAEVLAGNAAATTLEIADSIVNSGMLPFMAGSMEIEVGAEYFAGFDNYAIEGYKSAACFMPMMGSIAFVGYVFELEDGVDADAFMTALKENCNPRWNICVEADQTVCEEIDGKILFLMCPSDLGTDGGDEGCMGEPSGDVVYPVTLEEGTFGYANWTIFEDAMIEGALTTPFELANAIVESGILPFMAGAMEIEVGTEYFAGFDNYVIEGYKSAAAFMPMMGSIAYVGYIFEVEDGIDIHNFIADLTENCNPRWNICVEADETLVGAFGNKVFFLMCPISVE